VIQDGGGGGAANFRIALAAAERRFQDKKCDNRTILVFAKRDEA
jgi:hypothetical protein